MTNGRVWVASLLLAAAPAALFGAGGINLASNPNPSVFGQTITFEATVSCQIAATPTGTVDFYVDNVFAQTVSLVSAVATWTPNNLAVGVNHDIKAAYTGDGTCDPQTTSGFLQTVDRANTTTSLASTANPSVFGQSVTFTATVLATAPGSGTPTGSVTFTVDGVPQVPVTLSGGAATLTTSSLNVIGSPHSVSATYSGDTNFNASDSSSLSQTVIPANTVTSVVSSPNPSNAAASVTITATVAAAAPGGGVPTGTVSFFDGVTLLGTSALSSGQATLSTSVLTPGSHTIRATYGGSVDHNTSTQTTNHTVNRAATTTTVSPTTAVVVGQSTTLTATVTSSYPGTITGNVSFFDGVTSLGSATISSGQATKSVSFTTAGSHTITAVYGGDTNYATSNSSPVGQTVNQASTTTALNSAPNPSVFGQLVTFTATVSATAPGAGTATGNVQFKDGANVLGTVTLSGGGTGSMSTTGLSLGSHSITVTYLGDANFVTSTSSPVDQVVNQAATTTTLVPSLNPSTFGGAVTFTATVNAAAPGAGSPTGTVTFKDGASTLGTTTLNGSHVATFSTSTLTGGSHSITATYNADTNFAGSTSSPLSQVVNKAATSTALTSTGSTVVGGTRTYTATVTSSAGTPTGTVTFLDGAATLGTAPVNGSGVATFTVSSLSLGSHTVVARYDGDTNFATSTSAGVLTQVSRPETSTSTPVLRSGTPNAGENLTFAATVTGDGRITGSVTFRDFNVVIGSAAVDAQGTAVITTKLAIGNHMIVATYEGDTANSGSTSGAFFLTVRGTATVTLTSSANPSAAGASVTFTAAVASATTGGPAITGTVSFTDGTRALGSAALVNGQASVTATGLASGDHSIVASYSGDTVYQAANSAPLTQKVDRTPSTTVLDSGADANGYYLVATVRGAATGSTPTGAVTFEDPAANATLGSASLANGAATIRLSTPLPVGHQLRAVYAGDTTYAGSSSVTMPFLAAANAFSFGFSFAPDAIVSIFGSGLADSTVTAPSLPLPTTLGGVSVKLTDASGNAHNASLYFVSSGQINIVIPADMPAGSARLVVTNSRGSYSFAIVIAKSSPSLASGDGSGSGPAAAHILRVHADGSQDPLVVVTGAAVPFGSQTDSLYLILYGTGFRSAQGSTSCTLNGQSVSALYAGPHATYPGLDQINLQIPGSLRGAGSVTVSCAVSGQTSNTVTINVQ